MAMKRLRLNIDKLLSATRNQKVEWHARDWRKQEDGTLVQIGEPDYLPMDLGEVLDSPEAPMPGQLQAKEDQLRGMIGSGTRIWVCRKGKEHDVAYLVRFDHGKPESVDGYCQLPARVVPSDDEGWYEEQETADLPMADKDGWVSVGPGSFHVEQGTRGDVDPEYASSLKVGPSREVGAS